MRFAGLIVGLVALAACATPGLPPDIARARHAEAEARRLAPRYPVRTAIATDIYEGPAEMARYQGETKDGVYEGFGVLTLPDSAVVQAGRFHGGTLNGPGVERDIDGKILHEGIFIDGALAQRSAPSQPQ